MGASGVAGGLGRRKRPICIALLGAHRPGERAEVSIHAPVQGATSAPAARLAWQWFQSTRTCRARPAACRAASARHRFNPRARVGRDATSATSAARTICFNPRARVGRDASAHVRSWSLTCFNPRARVGCNLHGVAHAVIVRRRPLWTPVGAHHPMGMHLFSRHAGNCPKITQEGCRADYYD